MRSVRQSFASSTADRSRLPRYCSSLDSKRENSAKESAAEPGEPGQDAIVVQLADLAGGLFDDGVAEGDLAVAGHDGFVAMPNRQDGRRVKVVS